MIRSPLESLTRTPLAITLCPFSELGVKAGFASFIFKRRNVWFPIGWASASLISAAVGGLSALVLTGSLARFNSHALLGPGARQPTVWTTALVGKGFGPSCPTSRVVLIAGSVNSLEPAGKLVVFSK